MQMDKTYFWDANSCSGHLIQFLSALKWFIVSNLLLNCSLSYFVIPRLIMKFKQPSIPRIYVNTGRIHSSPLSPLPMFGRIVQYWKSRLATGSDLKGWNKIQLKIISPTCVYPASHGTQTADPAAICSPASEVSKPPVVLYCSPEATNCSRWAAQWSAAHGCKSGMYTSPCLRHSSLRSLL